MTGTHSRETFALFRAAGREDPDGGVKLLWFFSSEKNASPSPFHATR